MTEQVIDLGFRPRPWQQKALSGLKRFAVLVVHRRGGKTLAAIMKLIDSALRCQKAAGRFAFIAPELKQTKTVAWGYLRHYALKVPGTTVNESDLWVQFPNGAQIRLFGADNPDSLRGSYYDGIVLDEVAQMKPHVWGEVLMPALMDRQGWALFIGTPKGTNLLSERYFSALGEPETWSAQCFTIDDTQALPQEELAKARKNMTDQQWRQEMLCDFNASSDESLISLDLVRGALGKHHPEHVYDFAARIIGVDVALGGGDKTVIQKRQGLAAFVPQVLDYSNSQDIADVVAIAIDSFQADACFIDNSGGYGSGVVDRLRNLGFDPTGVLFGGKARDDRYHDRSAEMWWSLKCWLEEGGALPPDNRYLIELTGRLYTYDNARGKLQLESKEHMRNRGLRSPDLADALALTFASPVQPKVAAPARVIFGSLSGAQPVARGVESFLHNQGHRHEYDPFASFAEEQKRAVGS